MNNDATGAYLGIKGCGCAVAVCVDAPLFKDDLAEFCAEMIKDGLTLERVSLDESRGRVTMCECSDA